MPTLFDYQLDAIDKMKNGCILCGGVGSGKSRTALGYYYKENGGGFKDDPWMKNPCDLYIITTARKRDTKEWDEEISVFLLSQDPQKSSYKNKVVIDSWNNIQKYKQVKNSFFIFDEQRVVGSGVWVKTFLGIAKHNSWILLSATPGDTWGDYLPVFMANGFFKTKKEFSDNHIVWSPYVNFPKVLRYYNTRRLERLRDRILVDMDFDRKTVSHHENIRVEYDIVGYKQLGKTRWNPYKQQPIQTAAELCYTWRRIVNEDPSRQLALLDIFKTHRKLIVFYNYDYERDILLNLNYGENVLIAEWTGHKHEEIPKGTNWVYVVQYTAGAEGWNCITTDTIVFYSQSYSYKVLEQSCGRIDRLNTPFTDLYYYHLVSNSPIDIAISRAIKNKKKFNETRFVTRRDNAMRFASQNKKGGFFYETQN